MSDPAALGNPPNLPRFQVTPYKPDGGAEPSGVGMLVSALVVAGGALGFVAHYVSNWFYLIILFPCLIGLALGAIGIKMVKAGRVRNPLIGGLAGFLGGALAMGMMHYFDYEEFRHLPVMQNIRASMLEFSRLPLEQRQERYRQGHLSAEEQADAERAVAYASVDSFYKYMDLSARQGVEISSTRSGGTPMNLGYYGSIIYWIIELLIVAGITFAMIKKATAEPFCRSCRQWKKVNVLGFFNTPAAGVAPAVAGGDLSGIAAAGPTTEITNSRLSTANCPHGTPECGVDLKLEHLTTDNKGNLVAKVLAYVSYPGEARALLESLFVAKPAEESPESAPPAS